MRYATLLMAIDFLLCLYISPSYAVDFCSQMADANYTVTATDVLVCTPLSFSAPRTVFLPAAGGTLIGQGSSGPQSLAQNPTELKISDNNGVVSGSNTLTITPKPGQSINGVTNGTIILSSPLQQVTLYPFSGSSWYATVGLVGGGISPAAVNQVPIPGYNPGILANFVSGSSGTPVTAASPTIVISRLEAVTTNAQGGQNAALTIVDIGNNAGNGTSALDPNTIGLNIWAEQASGFNGDVVGITSYVTQYGTTGTYHNGAFGIFTSVSAGAPGTSAIGANPSVNNSSGADYPYSGFCAGGTCAATLGVSVQGGGANLNTAGVLLYATSPGQFDVGYTIFGGAVKTTGFEDDSNDVNVLNTTGSHTYGINLSNGSYSTASINAPGFVVNNVGQTSIINTPGNGLGVLHLANSNYTTGDIVSVFDGGNIASTNDTTTTLIYFRGSDDVILGSIKRNGPAAVIYNTTSDERLKTEINSEIKLGLDQLLQVKVHDFYFTADSERHPSNGLFAQELYSIYPFAVSPGGDNAQTNPWGVDYGRLTPLIIQGIQDLYAEWQEDHSKLLEIENQLRIKEPSK